MLLYFTDEDPGSDRLFGDAKLHSLTSDFKVTKKNVCPTYKPN